LERGVNEVPDAAVERSASERELADLMKAAQTGDTRSYMALLYAITPRVRHFVVRHRIFLDAADVDDLVQDTLLSLHAARATYDPERPFIPWLLAIARNRLADGARRYSRQGAYEVQVDSQNVTFVENETNIQVDTYRDPEALKHAINDLPRAQREAVEMLKLRQLSLKEASLLSGMSIGALKASVHRAVANLRKALSKDR
jgi:RNA polymerase sigma factor (sigma-70 family)